MEKFVCFKKDGKITNPKIVSKHFNAVPDGKWEITIKRFGRRSNTLNAYYWGCVVEYQQQGFKDLGHVLSKEEVHAFNKSEFDYKEIVNTDTGEIKKIPGSTKEMTNTQMMEFIEKIKQFSAEWLNVVIPDPNSQASIWDVSMQASYDQETKVTIVK